MEQKNSTEQKLEELYQADKKAFEDFVHSKTPTMDFASLRRLVISELSLKNAITPTRICGFSRKQILLMCQYPERYGKNILRLMNYMYQKSGYIKRLIDYFSNMAKAQFYIDTEVTSVKYMEKMNDPRFQAEIKKNYFKFSAQASKFNMSNQINDIIHRMMLNDIVFAYVDETETDVSYYYLDPRYCQLKGLVNGNIFSFYINRSLLSSSVVEEFPPSLQELLEGAKEQPSNLIDVPLKHSFCVKYNSDFLYAYPPFFPMIADVMLIDEYKDLAKTKAINDAYKLLVLKVPTKDGQMTMDDKVLSPFIQTAVQVIQDNIGVLPYPGDVDSVEFSSTNSDDRDKVSDATTWAFAEAGVSEALLSGSSSGSELKLSITNDSGDVFRIYRKIEDWISLQMKLRGFLDKSYRFVYRLLDITTFNSQEVIDSELKLAQASMPNKQKLAAAMGMSPASFMGNISIEQVMFRDVFDLMTPLKSSYTESSSDQGTAGRNQIDDGDLSTSGERARENDTNDPANRV